jgi:flavodoxin
MKKFLSVSVVLSMFLFFGSVSSFAQRSIAEKKILVAYFSWSGNTKLVAEQIQKEVGGTLYQIESASPYPKDYQTCVDYAKKEKENNVRPKLVGEVEALSSYDIIFIGYPNWWGTLPMPLFTFLEKYNLEGKTIIPFCTHGGGGAGQGFAEIRRLCPKSKILIGLAISSSKVKDSSSDIKGWIRKIGIVK